MSNLCPLDDIATIYDLPFIVGRIDGGIAWSIVVTNRSCNSNKFSWSEAKTHTGDIINNTRGDLLDGDLLCMYLGRVNDEYGNFVSVPTPTATSASAYPLETIAIIASRGYDSFWVDLYGNAHHPYLVKIKSDAQGFYYQEHINQSYQVGRYSNRQSIGGHHPGVLWSSTAVAQWVAQHNATPNSLPTTGPAPQLRSKPNSGVPGPVPGSAGPSDPLQLSLHEQQEIECYDKTIAPTKHKSGLCPKCQQPMKWLFTSSYCDCEDNLGNQRSQ